MFPEFIDTIQKTRALGHLLRQQQGEVCVIDLYNFIVKCDYQGIPQPFILPDITYVTVMQAFFNQIKPLFDCLNDLGCRVCLSGPLIENLLLANATPKIEIYVDRDDSVIRAMVNMPGFSNLEPLAIEFHLCQGVGAFVSALHGKRYTYASIENLENFDLRHNSLHELRIPPQQVRQLLGFSAESLNDPLQATHEAQAYLTLVPYLLNNEYKVANGSLLETVKHMDRVQSQQQLEIAKLQNMEQESISLQTELERLNEVIALKKIVVDELSQAHLQEKNALEESIADRKAYEALTKSLMNSFQLESQKFKDKSDAFLNQQKLAQEKLTETKKEIQQARLDLIGINKAKIAVTKKRGEEQQKLEGLVSQSKELEIALTAQQSELTSLNQTLQVKEEAIKNSSIKELEIHEKIQALEKKLEMARQERLALKNERREVFAKEKQISVDERCSAAPIETVNQSIDESSTPSEEPKEKSKDVIIAKKPKKNKKAKSTVIKLDGWTFLDHDPIDLSEEYLNEIKESKDYKIFCDHTFEWEDNTLDRMTWTVQKSTAFLQLLLQKWENNRQALTDLNFFYLKVNSLEEIRKYSNKSDRVIFLLMLDKKVHSYRYISPKKSPQLLDSIDSEQFITESGFEEAISDGDLFGKMAERLWLHGKLGGCISNTQFDPHIKYLMQNQGVVPNARIWTLLKNGPRRHWDTMYLSTQILMTHLTQCETHNEKRQSYLNIFRQRMKASPLRPNDSEYSSRLVILDQLIDENGVENDALKKWYTTIEIPRMKNHEKYLLNLIFFRAHSLLSHFAEHAEPEAIKAQFRTRDAEDNYPDEIAAAFWPESMEIFQKMLIKTGPFGRRKTFNKEKFETAIRDGDLDSIRALATVATDKDIQRGLYLAIFEAEVPVLRCLLEQCYGCVEKTEIDMLKIFPFTEDLAIQSNQIAKFIFLYRYRLTPTLDSLLKRFLPYLQVALDTLLAINNDDTNKFDQYFSLLPQQPAVLHEYFIYALHNHKQKILTHIVNVHQFDLNTFDSNGIRPLSHALKLGYEYVTKPEKLSISRVIRTLISLGAPVDETAKMLRIKHKLPKNILDPVSISESSSGMFCIEVDENDKPDLECEIQYAIAHIKDLRYP